MTIRTFRNVLWALAALLLALPASGDPTYNGIYNAGEGTINSQHMVHQPWVATCETTSSTTVSCGSFSLPATDQTSMLVIRYIVRDATTHANTSDALGVIYCGITNVAGTVTALNGSTTAICAATNSSTTISGSKAALTGLTIVASISGTTVTIKAGGITGTDTYDWLLDLDRISN
jgi:hypothetical protein